MRIDKHHILMVSLKFSIAKHCKFIKSLIKYGEQ